MTLPVAAVAARRCSSSPRWSRFYVLLQLRRKAYAARFTNVALLGSLVPKRPGWRRHLAFGVVALGPGRAGRLAGRAEHARCGCRASGPR